MKSKFSKILTPLSILFLTVVCEPGLARYLKEHTTHPAHTSHHTMISDLYHHLYKITIQSHSSLILPSRSIDPLTDKRLLGINFHAPKNLVLASTDAFKPIFSKSPKESALWCAPVTKNDIKNRKYNPFFKIEQHTEDIINIPIDNLYSMLSINVTAVLETVIFSQEFELGLLITNEKAQDYVFTNFEYPTKDNFFYLKTKDNNPNLLEHSWHTDILYTFKQKGMHKITVVARVTKQFEKNNIPTICFTEAAVTPVFFNYPSSDRLTPNHTELNIPITIHKKED